MIFSYYSCIVQINLLVSNPDEVAFFKILFFVSSPIVFLRERIHSSSQLGLPTSA